MKTYTLLVLLVDWSVVHIFVITTLSSIHTNTCMILNLKNNRIFSILFILANYKKNRKINEI